MASGEQTKRSHHLLERTAVGGHTMPKRAHTTRHA
jgi:hypothetical protein